tara:strand:+ start:265 stop:447 length:183 start_codon:yes stop_codon:yes gene_type:complete
MKNLQKLVKYICPLINRPLPSVKLVNNKLYILNTDGKYVKIKKQKKPEFIEDISELDKYK